MTDNTIPSSIFVSSPLVEKNQENQEFDDFQDIGYMNDTVTVTLTVTVGDLHRLNCMTNAQCANVVHHFSAALAPQYLTYQRIPSEPDAPIPNIEDAFNERVRNAIMERKADDDAIREKFRAYGKMGGRPRKNQPESDSEKTQKPPFSKPSGKASEQTSKTPFSKLEKDRFSSTKNPLSSRTHARSINNNLINIENNKNIGNKERGGDCLENGVLNGNSRNDSKRGSWQSQFWRSSSGGDFQWDYDVPMDAAWIPFKNPTIRQILGVIPTPGDRSIWTPTSIAIIRSRVGYEAWDEWCRRGKNYNKERNLDFYNSVINGDAKEFDDDGLKITVLLLYAIWWHGFKVVRPFLGVSSASGGNSGKHHADSADDSVANGWKKRGENNGFVPASGHAVCGESGSEKVAEVANEVSENSDIPSDDELQRMMVDFMTKRGFTMETIAKMQCKGVWFRKEGRPAIRFPYLGVKGRYFYRFMDVEPNAHDGKSRYYTPGGDALNYGEPILAHDEIKDIVLVEGEFDAATLMQAGFPAISVKNMGSLFAAMDAHPSFGRRFFILRDNDKAGEQKARAWADAMEKHGVAYSGCQLPCDVNDANAYLMKYGELSLKEQMQKIMMGDTQGCIEMTA